MDAKGYGSTANKALYFDGDESHYEIWEQRMLAYMKVKKLKDVTSNSLLVMRLKMKSV